jgi:hypothetical protein
MPTKRAWVFIILALGLYLLANQTQVGWVYIMTNSLVGLLLVTFFYALGMLKPIRVHRTFHTLSTHPSVSSLPTNNRQNRVPSSVSNDDSVLKPPDLFEDDPIEVTLQFKHTGLKPALLVGGQEFCPFAPSSDQLRPFFIPGLFKNQSVSLDYQTLCNRRGTYNFSTMKLRSKGPFSLFNTGRTLAIPSEILIYPKYHPLKRIRLLESRGFADKQARRVGVSSEVIGTREYHHGDTLRQIHWRSTARVGRLVVKEFSDNDQLTMTVVLDLATWGNVGQGKFSTFETAIRIAASLGYYATQQGIPFRLVGHSQGWKPPATALSWWGILNYLAKVENDGQEPLANVLRNLPPLPFVVVLISHPDQAINQELVSLQRKETQMLAIFITPDGTTPTAALLQNRPALEIKTVSPYNWSTVLDEL